MAFKYDENDGLDDVNITNALSEDALAKKRRTHSDLTHALGVLGVKHSTFASMLKRGEHPAVRKMLKIHLKVRLMKEQTPFSKFYRYFLNGSERFVHCKI